MPRPMTTFRALSEGGQLCLWFVCCCLMDHRSRLAATAQASGAWLTTVAQSRPAPQDCPSLHVGFRLRLFAVLSRARRKALCPLVLSSLLADHQVWRQRRARLGPAPSSSAVVRLACPLEAFFGHGPILDGRFHFRDASQRANFVLECM